MKQYDLHDRILWAWSETTDGNQAFRYGTHQQVLDKRCQFLDQIDLDINNCVGMQVEHADRIAAVDSSMIGMGMRRGETAVVSDTLITTTPGIGLFLTTADCLPIVLYEPNSNLVALCHIGWRNL